MPKTGNIDDLSIEPFKKNIHLGLSVSTQIFGVVSNFPCIQILYGPEFLYQVLFSTTRFSSVLSCEDILISSIHRSANI